MASNNKDNSTVIFIAVFLIFFVIIVALLRKLFNSLNTEPTVLDEASKKILNDKQLVEDYYAAIEKEKNGESADITIEGEKYKIIRAGKYNQTIIAN